MWKRHVDISRVCISGPWKLTPVKKSRGHHESSMGCAIMNRALPESNIIIKDKRHLQ